MAERSNVTTKWAVFACDATEHKFRLENLTEDAKAVRFLSVFTYCLVASFVSMDLTLKGVTPVFVTLLGTRFVILASTAILVVRLRRAIAPSDFDHWLLIWVAAVISMALYSLSTRTPQQAAPTCVLCLLIISLLVPMRFIFQAGAATVTCIALMALMVSKKPESSVLAGVLIALIATLAVGLISSRRLHRSRREAFASRLIERATVGKLEEALAAVKKLEGILRMCAWCKKIQQVDDTWIVVEDYISERSEARFSHGLCPHCVPNVR